MLQIEAWLSEDAAAEAQTLLESSGAGMCGITQTTKVDRVLSPGQIRLVATIATVHAAAVLPLFTQLVARAEGFAFVTSVS